MPWPSSRQACKPSRASIVAKAAPLVRREHGKWCQRKPGDRLFVRFDHELAEEDEPDDGTFDFGHEAKPGEALLVEQLDQARAHRRRQRPRGRSGRWHVYLVGVLGRTIVMAPPFHDDQPGCHDQQDPPGRFAEISGIGCQLI